ncbi:MAG TPA: bifunctional 4-hydroxy-2-oxoglutarate aldolase/2-dehydro-3-deoxy-phosphogluconate aldolase [Spirochaetia bacterium]|nr:bifunctional 4-hydroxy-2-oxoglutarate aldolase/2-dehydro-3-deoxy-phosphogluconate aldolase [Spirochaetia bacterium]
MDDVFAKIKETKLVPVVKINDAKDAIPLGKALIAGGLPVAEITFRTDAAEESIRKLAAEVPGLLVGAGTVLTTDQVDRAIQAGARFIVSPGFNPRIVDYCIAKKIPVIPGINSPSQVEMGLERGLTILKFFPAEASGGIQMLKALAGPYVGVKYIPTGGISADNLVEYLKLSCVFACGGSWMVKDELISSGRFDEITRLTAEAVRRVKSAL